MKPVLLLVLIAVATLLRAAPAEAALNCTATISDVAFGAAVDVLPGTAIDATGTLQLDCTDIPLLGVRICPYIGNGSGGRDATARYMTSGTDSLAYQLYTDAGRTQIWGDPNLGFGTTPTVDLPGNLAANATGHATLTLYGRILANQRTVKPASYVSTFNVSFTYGINVLGLVACNAIPLLTSTITGTFAATATVEKNCYLTANNLNFGTRGVLNSATLASTALTLRCSSTIAYSIGLDNGLTGTAPGTRLMKKGSETISYGLFKDDAYADLWGNAGALLRSGTGSGNDQSVSVYGRVPPQPTPSPGVYLDTVVVTVTY